MALQGQTPIPNGSFEVWINHGGYANPQFWDSDNKTANSIPFFGKVVVNQDNDHSTGSYSAKLETKNIPFIPFDVPGILTLGTLTVNLLAGTYTLTGGVPIHDTPTHLKGFYKYSPKGSDSCVIAIGLSRINNGVRDSFALGYFSTQNTMSTWAPFSAYIKYDTAAAPDSFNILIISSAVASPTAGTILYVDGLELDYSLGIDNEDPSNGILIYHDRGKKEILSFFDFKIPENTSLCIYDIMGRRSARILPEMILKKTVTISYDGWIPGIYILEIIHGKSRFVRKFLLNN